MGRARTTTVWVWLAAGWAAAGGMLAGCGETEAEPGVDARASDGGPADARPVAEDSGRLTPDARSTDAGAADGDTPDGGLPDGGPGDGGASDAEAPDRGPPDPLACNGARQLCDRPLPAVAFAMTHNAHAVLPPFNRVNANQTLPIAEQLALGVRGLGIKLYVTDDAPCGPLGLYGYHGFSNLGCVPFADIGAPVAAFLAANPREVLVVTVEGDADAASVRQGFEAAGLMPSLHVQAPGAAWPTLGALIEAGHRLVLFKAGDADAEAGLHPMWDLIQDTPYDYRETAEFSCAHLRGAADAPLFLLNHFLTRISPVIGEAPTTNGLAVLGPRVLDCAETRGLPTLVYVDFVQLGDALAVVDLINGPGDEAARKAALAAALGR